MDAQCAIGRPSKWSGSTQIESPPPRQNLSVWLHDLADNFVDKYRPHLKDAIEQIKTSYSIYLECGGDACAIRRSKVELSTTPFLGGLLRSLYNSPPLQLSFVKKQRSEMSHRTCPMCGSFHCGTLDHIFPKEDFAIYSVFAPNLVPACNACNTSRGANLTGPAPGARILHPYFDELLGDRLLSAEFTDLGQTPRVGVRILVEPHHPQFSAVKFHVDKVVLKTPIVRYLGDRWSDLLRKPSSVRPLKKRPRSVNGLRSALEEELSELDDDLKGKNNWSSIFVAGLLDEPVVDWLFARLHAVERAKNGPLIPHI